MDEQSNREAQLKQILEEDRRKAKLLKTAEIAEMLLKYESGADRTVTKVRHWSTRHRLLWPVNLADAG